jgi:hypothetical protein
LVKPTLASIALEHRLQCRTWACRLALRLPEVQRYNPAKVNVRDYRWGDFVDDELERRVLDVSGDKRTSGEGLEEVPGTYVFVVYMRLRQPSGQPLAGGVLTPPPRPLVLPATSADCEEQGIRLDRELAAERARWIEVEPLDHKFERGSPNPELARWVEARVPWFTNALASTECRGNVCRQSNKVALLGQTFWVKRVSDGRSTIHDEGNESVVYHEVDRN